MQAKRYWQLMAMPLRVEEALSGEEDISYRNFGDGMQALLAGDANLQVQTLANKWQDNAPQIALWCQQMAHDEYIKRQQAIDFKRYEACVDAVNAAARRCKTNQWYFLGY